ncbi:uncharacterized protein LOC133722193 [Rosa rugosa]|uniref:uncharacterized protein LOC133722193 n=1 Tax=Rosa rugosa TaxID=74645 RepID=UPI002B40DD2A|nr:uncharacterized protein LOC133722193 [Rosa rugosa]
MEETAPVTAKDSDLKRQRSFGKAYKTFQTQATSLVGLARQFKELQARWGSTEDELRKRFREVRDREREVVVREKQLEEKEAKWKQVEMEAQKKEVESSKYHLLFLRPLISKHVQELDDLKVMVSEKKKERDLIEKRGLEWTERLNSVEKCVEEKTKELESKEEEVRGVEGRLRISREEIELKERELSGILETIEECKRECGLKEEEIEAKRRYIDEWEKEMDLKREELVDQLDAMKILVREKGKECELIENRVLESSTRSYYFGKCVEERRKEFEAKEKELKEVQGCIELKERELDGILKSIQEHTKECDLKGKQVKALEWSIEKCEKEMELKREEWSRKLELKEMELERLFEKFELRGQQLEPIVEELRGIDKRVDGCLNEGLCEERYLQTCEKLIQERERCLDSVSHELKMKERHIEEEAKELELKKIQFYSQVKTQQLEREKHFASLKKWLEQQDQSLYALQKSIEEVKKLSERRLEQQGGVIELKQKLFDSQLLEREEQLGSIGKSIEECDKQFNGVQKLVREQKKHLDSLSHTLHIRETQAEKQVKELELNLKHSDFEVSTKQLELTPAADDMIIPHSVSDQPNINRDDRSFEVIPGIIRNLIERKQLLKAVTYICTFKQIDKFPPVPLLKEFVEDAKKSCTELIFSKEISHDVKEKVVDDLIADLRAVIQCIEDHSLESQYPPTDFSILIQGLGELKENPKLVLSLPSNVEKQEQRKGRKRSSSSAPSTSHTYQLRKRT